MKRVLILTLAVGLFMVGATTNANAHKIKAGKARQLTQKLASYDCSRVSWCTRFGWECAAPKGPHRVPCKEHLWDDPNRTHCVVGLTIGLYAGSNKVYLQKVGNPKCFGF